MILKVSFLIIFAIGSDSLTCYEEGQCQGTLLNAQVKHTYNECLDFCQNTSECQWFTFFDDTENCILQLDCPFIDKSCQFCHVGQTSCPEREAHCQLQIACNGQLVAPLESALDDQKCLESCKENSQCRWFTFLTDVKSCSLMSDCDIYDDTCQNCISGESNCEASPPIGNSTGDECKKLIHEARLTVTVGSD